MLSEGTSDGYENIANCLKNFTDFHFTLNIF